MLWSPTSLGCEAGRRGGAEAAAHFDHAGSVDTAWSKRGFDFGTGGL